jgi:hypothetical protein
MNKQDREEFMQIAIQMHKLKGVMRNFMPKLKVTDNSGDPCTPTYLAFEQSTFEIAKYLFEQEPFKPISYLLLVTIYEQHDCPNYHVYEKVQYLLSKGARPNYVYNGFTPMHDAAEYPEPHVLQALIKAGGKSTIKNDDGNTPTQIAEREELETNIALLQPSLVKSKICRTCINNLQHMDCCPKPISKTKPHHKNCPYFLELTLQPI